MDSSGARGSKGLGNRERFLGLPEPRTAVGHADLEQGADGDEPDPASRRPTHDLFDYLDPVEDSPQATRARPEPAHTVRGAGGWPPGAARRPLGPQPLSA